MEISLHEHPSNDQLQAFAEGRLQDHMTEQIGSHVEACDQCADYVDELKVDAESIVFQPLNASPRAQTFADDATGEIALDDRLELQEVIGSGGMGVVYRAWQPNVHRHVAVKQLHVPLPQQSPGSLQAKERFEREIRALGSVLHPHLARIYSSGVTAEGRLFYSMELIEVANLSILFRELVRQSKLDLPKCSWHAAVKIACEGEAESDGERTGADEGVADVEWKNADPDIDERYVQIVVMLMRQIATAVQTLHDSGIVHRDIKPGNIMVSATGNHATLMDLGLAGLVDDQEVRLTRSGLIAGSLPYISPEQFRGEPPSTSGDIYNLGAVLWELLTLQKLFQDAANSSEAEMMHRILHEDAGTIREH